MGGRVRQILYENPLKYLRESKDASSLTPCLPTCPDRAQQQGVLIRILIKGVLTCRVVRRVSEQKALCGSQKASGARGMPGLGVQAGPGSASRASAARTRTPEPAPSPKVICSSTSRQSFFVRKLCKGCELSKLPEAGSSAPLHRWAASWCAPRCGTTFPATRLRLPQGESLNTA